LVQRIFCTFNQIAFANFVHDFHSIRVEFDFKLTDNAVNLGHRYIFLTSELREDALSGLHEIFSRTLRLLLEHIEGNEVRVLRILGKVVQLNFGRLQPAVGIINQTGGLVSQGLELRFDEVEILV